MGSPVVTSDHSGRKWRRICWQLLAIFLVLFALGVSLIRGLLPQLDSVREQLVEYLHYEYQVEVQAGELSAQWQAYGPAININDLVIPPQDKLPVTVIIRNVQIKLDFWQSVLTASPRVEDVIFDGVSVALDIDKLLAPKATNQQTAKTDWLYKLLLEQLDRFAFTNVSLQLLSDDHHYRPIHIRHLNWRNEGERHRGAGEVYLDENALAQESLSLQLDVHGDGNKPDSLTGQIYLAANSLDLGAWASRQPNPYDPSTKLPLQGVVNLEAWLSFAQRSITSGLVQFDPSWLQWSLRDEPQKFDIRQGRLQWQPSDDGWQVTSSQLDFATNGVAWPELTLGVKRQADSVFAYINQIDTQGLLPLLPLLPLVDKTVLRQWHALKPQGSIGPIKLYHKDNQPWLASADVSQLHWQKIDAVPAISALDAKLLLNGDMLSIYLPAQHYDIDFGDEFTAPIQLDAKAIAAHYHFAEQSLSLPALEVENEDLALDAALKLHFNEQTHMALAANVHIKNAANADKYFPVQAMGESLSDYLSGAILAGQSQDAHVLWQGNLAGFPYEDNSGVFQAAFSLTDAQYAFQPDWPVITDLSLNALFENTRMDIWVNKGKLLKVNADGAHVYIPQIGEQTRLKIDANLKTQGSAATQVLQASPLADSVGAALKVLQVQGAVTGRLDLSIPLYEGDEADIRGEIGFANTPIYLAEPGVQLNAVNGTVNFVNEIVTGKNLKARLFEQPLTLNFSTQNIGQDYGLNLDLLGRWDLATLAPALANPLSEFYQGKLKWDGTLAMRFHEQGYTIDAQVNSDLVGTTLTLPGYLAKSSDEPRALSATFVGDETHASLNAKLDNLVEFVGGFDAQTGAKMRYFDLLLGRLFAENETPNAQQGHIQIDLAKGKLTNWLPLINAFIREDVTPRDGILLDEVETNGFLPPLKRIDAKIGRFDLMGQMLTQLHVNAAPTELGWRFNAQADEFDGWIDFYPDWMAQGLKLEAKKWYLSPEIKHGSDADFGSEQVLTNLPPVAINVEDFQFFGKSFGRLALQASPDKNGYNIQTLSLTSKDVNLSGSGMWRQQAGQNDTQFDLKLSARQFQLLSQRLGIDPGVNDAPLNIDASLAWQGAPYEFSLETLNGQVKFDLGKGHLSQVSDKGARIFSLFSLDSLVRKLSLDFTDVFGQGMYFDSFNGNLQIDQGVVKTTDTEMDAIVGNMKVRGYTDLTSQSLNYDIRFVPQLASSVPTVVLLSTSAWTLGLGAFALTKVLEPVIEVISELRFRVTGTMAEPVVEELERKSKEIEIPESILPAAEQKDNAASAEQNTLPPASVDNPNLKTQPQSSGASIGKKEGALDSGVQEVKLDTLQPTSQSLKPQREQATQAKTGDNRSVQVFNFSAVIAQRTKPSIQSIQGEQDARQFIAMPEQPRRQRQSAVYRIAA